MARYEQFPLFPQCFQKACFAGASKGVIVWEWGKTHSCQSVTYTDNELFTKRHHFTRLYIQDVADDKSEEVQMMAFIFGKVKNIEEKGENVVYRHLPILSQCLKKASPYGYAKLGDCSVIG